MLKITAGCHRQIVLSRHQPNFLQSSHMDNLYFGFAFCFFPPGSRADEIRGSLQRAMELGPSIEKMRMREEVLEAEALLRKKELEVVRAKVEDLETLLERSRHREKSTETAVKSSTELRNRFGIWKS